MLAAEEALANDELCAATDELDVAKLVRFGGDNIDPDEDESPNIVDEAPVEVLLMVVVVCTNELKVLMVGENIELILVELLLVEALLISIAFEELLLDKPLL